MIVAVTGASGFVGGHVVRALLERGHELYTFGTRASSELASKLPNYQSWRIEQGAISAPHVDAVVHCAALVGDWGDERAYREVNVAGTQAVLDTFPNARVVHMSTTSVYSDHQSAPILSESAPTGDCKYSAYGRTKALAEQLVLKRHGAIVLRPHIVYGPGDTTLLPRVIASRRFGALMVPGNGQNTVSITNVVNLASAVVASVQQPNVAGVFNIADNVTATLDQLLREVLSREGIAPRLVYIPKSIAWALAAVAESLYISNTPPRGPRITRYVINQMTSSHTLDITKAKIQLGYDPQLDFRSQQ